MARQSQIRSERMLREHHEVFICDLRARGCVSGAVIHLVTIPNCLKQTTYRNSLNIGILNETTFPRHDARQTPRQQAKARPSL